MKPVIISTQAAGKRVKNFREVELGFSKKKAIEEARKFPQSNDPSCQPRCPLGVDILGFVRLLREGETNEAYQKIRQANDLPGICGRVCMAPCEEEFIIGGKKMPIDVRALERFVADHGRPKFFGRDKLTCAKDRVAIIGSGPAGLSAAAILARELYCVTVFESLPLLGGVLRYGIPEFRLSHQQLDAEIGQIRDLGVDFQTQMTFGRNMTLSDLEKQKFKAVVLATGRAYPRFLDLPGADAAGILYAQELLLRLNFSQNSFEQEFGSKLGKRVLVLGGQNMALDCARACRRLGKEVGVVFSGTEEEIDAHRNELAYAKEEGVAFHIMMRPLSVHMDETGSVSSLKCQKMDFAEKQGKWILMPVPGAEHQIEADTIIAAQGCTAGSLVKKTIPALKMNEDGTVWIDEDTGQTSVENIFAAGDLVCAKEHVLESMVSGKKAANQIMKFLS